MLPPSNAGADGKDHVWDAQLRSGRRSYAQVIGARSWKGGTFLPDHAANRSKGARRSSHGNVYIAAGQIYVYSPAGKLIDTIEVPERPLQLVFGASDGRTLSSPARTSLYAVRSRFKGSRE